jgi:hypothetical protein
MGNHRFPYLHPPFFIKKVLSYLLTLLALIVMGWPVHVLIVEDTISGTVVWCRFIQRGDRLVLMYRHSVELCHVWDHFLIDGEYRLVLNETVFPSSNTGLPSVLGDGERLVRDEKGFRITNMHRVLPAIAVWVDRQYDNTLMFGRQTVFLPDLAGNKLLRLQTRQAALAEFIYFKLH